MLYPELQQINVLLLFIDTGAHHGDTDLAVEYLIQSLHHAAKVAVPVSLPINWRSIIANARRQFKMAHAKWSEADCPDYKHPLSASRQTAKKLLRRAVRQQAARNRCNNKN